MRAPENSAQRRLIRKVIQPSFRRLAGPLGSGGKIQGSPLGAIAQLVERLNGIQEVSGSTPLSSTIKASADNAGAFSIWFALPACACLNAVLVALSPGADLSAWRAFTSQ